MRLLKKYSMRRRGRIEPPIEPVGQSAFLLSARTRYVCASNPFIHFIYGNHDLVAQSE